MRRKRASMVALAILLASFLHCVTLRSLCPVATPRDVAAGEREVLDPELTDEAGRLVVLSGIPHRMGGAPALITDRTYGPEFNATVAFDAGQKKTREIPPGIGGINLEVQFNGFNLVTDQGELRPSVVACLRQLHLAGKTLRWPGGGYDDLHYQHCLGEVSERPLQAFFGGHPQRCTFGPKEASELAEGLDAELWMQVQPMLVPDPPDQNEHITHGALPVHQHNSGAPGTINRRVANWQLGNEQYHYAEDRYSVRTFIAAARHLIEAMRREDARIRFWAPVQENYANNHFSRQPDWTQQVLEHLADDLHGLTVHNGYAPVVPRANSPTEVADAYRAMFSNALWAGENLQAIETVIRETAPRHDDRLRLAITEANAMFGILPFEHNMMNHAQTLASAAYVGSMLATYARHPRVDYVHLFTGVQFTAQGLIGVTDGNFSTPPNTFSSMGLLLHLWNQWAKGSVLSNVEVKTPSFSSLDMGWMRGRDDIPFLEVLVRRNGQEIGILLINRSLTESARVELNVSGFSLSRLTARALLGRAPDSNPGLTIPNIVKPVKGAVLERFDRGREGEVWIRTEEARDLSRWPSIRVPRSALVFLHSTAQ